MNVGVKFQVLLKIPEFIETIPKKRKKSTFWNVETVCWCGNKSEQMLKGSCLTEIIFPV